MAKAKAVDAVEPTVTLTMTVREFYFVESLLVIRYKQHAAKSHYLNVGKEVKTEQSEAAKKVLEFAAKLKKQAFPKADQN